MGLCGWKMHVMFNMILGCLQELFVLHPFLCTAFLRNFQNLIRIVFNSKALLICALLLPGNDDLYALFHAIWLDWSNCSWWHISLAEMNTQPSITYETHLNSTLCTLTYITYKYLKWNRKVPLITMKLAFSTKCKPNSVEIKRKKTCRLKCSYREIGVN